jgi:hypothetical protein
MFNKKVFSVIACLVIGVMSVPKMAFAVTTADLLAQIQALQVQITKLQEQLAATSGIPAKCVGITFTRELSLSSVGADVVCLQVLLNQNAATRVAVSGPGSLGLETQKFGALTKAAVIKFQNKYASEILTPDGLSNGSGIVSAKTRAKLNAILAALKKDSGDDTVDNNGPEGDLSVSLNSSPATGVKVYEGSSKVSVLGIKAVAADSDIQIQRVKLQFENVKPYNYLTKVYLYEGSSLLASSELSSSTMTKSGSDYTIMLDGFTDKITKGSSKIFTVKVDGKDSISASLPQDIKITVPDEGVRGTDGAGLSKLSPSDPISRTCKVYEKGSTSDNASLVVSKSSDTPAARNISAGSDGEAGRVELLIFNVKAVNGSVDVNEINNVVFGAASGKKAIYPETAYLFDSNDEEIASAEVGSDHKADFMDLSIHIGSGIKEIYTIKADYVDVLDSYASVVTVNSGSNIDADNSDGDSLSSSEKTGSAASYAVTFYGDMPDFSMTNVTATKTPKTDTEPSILDATFTVRISALNKDIYIPKTAAFLVKRVKDNTTSTATTADVESSYGKPANADESGNYYKIGSDSSATFTVNSNLNTEGWGKTTNYYDLRIVQIEWASYVDAKLVKSTSGDLTDTFKSKKVLMP